MHSLTQTGAVPSSSGRAIFDARDRRGAVQRPMGADVGSFRALPRPGNVYDIPWMDNLARVTQQAHYIALAEMARQRADRAEERMECGLAAAHMRLAKDYEELAHSAGVLARFPSG